MSASRSLASLLVPQTNLMVKDYTALVKESRLLLDIPHYGTFTYPNRSQGTQVRCCVVDPTVKSFIASSFFSVFAKLMIASINLGEATRTVGTAKSSSSPIKPHCPTFSTLFSDVRV